MTEAAIAVQEYAETQLGFLEHAATYLAQARSIDDVKLIRDKAQAITAYARQQKLGLQMQNDAAEVKIRAERRVGELLADTELNKGGRPKENQSNDTTGFYSLKEMGLSRDDSSRWQKLAGMSDVDFEQYLASTRDAGKELTTAGVLRAASSTNPDTIPDPKFWEFDEILDAVAESAAAICEKCPPTFRDSLARRLISLGEELLKRGEL